LRGLAQQALKRSARVADRLRPPAAGAVVLVYHRIGGSSGLDIDMPAAMFDAQMALLAASGRAAPIDAALARIGCIEPADLDPVVVTFDDGTADFADAAMPILERHRIPVTLYVATDFVERQVPFPHEGTPISWGALDDVQETGLVTVGAHTHTHALLDRLDPHDVETELDHSDALIEQRLGRRPAHFAYPKAVPGSAAADAAVRRRYRSAAVAGTRPNPYGRTDPHRLARSPIQVSDGMEYFRAKLAGGMGLEDRVRTLANRWRYRAAAG